MRLAWRWPIPSSRCGPLRCRPGTGKEVRALTVLSELNRLRLTWIAAPIADIVDEIRDFGPDRYRLSPFASSTSPTATLCPGLRQRIGRMEGRQFQELAGDVSLRPIRTQGKDRPKRDCRRRNSPPSAGGCCTIGSRKSTRSCEQRIGSRPRGRNAHPAIRFLRLAARDRDAHPTVCHRLTVCRRWRGSATGEYSTSRSAVIVAQRGSQSDFANCTNHPGEHSCQSARISGWLRSIGWNFWIRRCRAGWSSRYPRCEDPRGGGSRRVSPRRWRTCIARTGATSVPTRQSG